MQGIFANLKEGINKLFGVAIFVLIGIFFAVGVGYARWQSQTEQSVVADDGGLSVTERIKTFTNLPQNEEPVIVRVTDVTLLPQNNFFKNAQNNDIVIIYPMAKDAYLYRESTHEIVEIVAIDDSGMPIKGEDSGGGEATP